MMDPITMDSTTRTAINALPETASLSRTIKSHGVSKASQIEDIPNLEINYTKSARSRPIF